jgi:hypothetical protein
MPCFAFCLHSMTALSRSETFFFTCIRVNRKFRFYIPAHFSQIHCRKHTTPPLIQQPNLPPNHPNQPTSASISHYSTISLPNSRICPTGTKTQKPNYLILFYYGKGQRGPNEHTYNSARLGKGWVNPAISNSRWKRKLVLPERNREMSKSCTSDSSAKA